MLLRKITAPEASFRTRLLGRIWIAFSVTVLGLVSGLAALWIGANSYATLDGSEMFSSYFKLPQLVFLNLLMPLLVMWAVFLLTDRAWLAFPAAHFLPGAIALVNFYKIQFRSDPFLAADLRVANEGMEFAGRFEFDPVWPLQLVLGTLAAGTVLALLLVPRSRIRVRERLFSAASCAAMAAVCFSVFYLDSGIYEQIDNGENINPLFDTHLYISKGNIYSFLYSSRELLNITDEVHDIESGEETFRDYQDADIPEDRKVSVLGIMLEAFADFTDFPVLADSPGVQEAYAPWHELSDRSVSGRLLTNIFGGGTVDTEWAFLAGYSKHDEFTRPVDSYVWYLRNQGYQTFGSHMHVKDFYDRVNINRYLGFQEYWFSENHYAAYLSPEKAVARSDDLLVQTLTDQLKERIQDGPCFSFSVSLQNHGPYLDTPDYERDWLGPDVVLEEDDRNILNHYLDGVSKTCADLAGMVDVVEQMEEPVVVVLFGDHKPWGGNGNEVYRNLGINFDTATLEGFYEYYATPYLIWANTAAKQVLGNDFTGDGGDFSGCYLMPKLFDLCGWEGPGFMQLVRNVREITPLLHSSGLYLKDGELTTELPADEENAVQQFLDAQYYRETEVVPEGAGSIGSEESFLGDPVEVPGAAGSTSSIPAEVPGGAESIPGGTGEVPGGTDIQPGGGTGNQGGGGTGTRPGGTDRFPAWPWFRPGGNGGNQGGGTGNPPGGESSEPAGSEEIPAGSESLPGGPDVSGGTGTPEEPGDVPDGSENVPGVPGVLPGGSESTPGDPGTVPGGDEPVPEDPGTEPVPEDPGTVPGGDEPVPGEPGTVPGGDEPVPEDPGTVPGGDEPVPENPGTVPGGDQPVPEDPGTVPGGDQPVPEDPGTVPGGGEPAPSEPGTVPGGGVTEPGGIPQGTQPADPGTVPAVPGGQEIPPAEMQP